MNQFPISLRRLSILFFGIIPLLVIAAPSPTAYKEIEWTELMPADDLIALLNPPEQILGIEDGSQQDSFSSFALRQSDDEGTRRFKQALTSTNVVPEFDKKAIRLPGFVVPLGFNESQKVTEFFIVPYFGACLHLPPPPPNQIVYATSDLGIDVDDLYQPFWFEGTIIIETVTNEMGLSAYKMALDNVEEFEDI
ncbi:DUF3299 domain-containing protein [Alteromonas sp. 5E99-2]|uniref:DUF3299 domain-containing protein n=1 Tax=Alteromonas sp. 5E99-2 TaxID=2817683 RepID=UPI001A97E2C9|nr:DUF3299 domain-containing protein [Alteromonas sp. 5E99-2]MBO1255012.1 DUF3299 domain-containing protein [Alteromonas sp. 5E99-2]